MVHLSIIDYHHSQMDLIWYPIQLYFQPLIGSSQYSFYRKYSVAHWFLSLVFHQWRTYLISTDSHWSIKLEIGIQSCPSSHAFHPNTILSHYRYVHGFHSSILIWSLRHECYSSLIKHWECWGSHHWFHWDTKCSHQSYPSSISHLSRTTLLFSQCHVWFSLIIYSSFPAESSPTHIIW